MVRRVCALTLIGFTAGKKKTQYPGVKVEAFNVSKCLTCVEEVHKSGKYTEESISPICERELEWDKCDFFAEALSLASSHQDFNNTQFCDHMDQAHFCSHSMDSLLSSEPVSDLAFGQCTRAEPKKSDKYCKKFQRMFSYAVQSEDLDTIRACYMIEAYSNMTDSQKELEQEPEEEPPKPAEPKIVAKDRIITSSGRELEPAGDGKAHDRRTPPGVTKFGSEGIVVKPVPLKNYGAGNGSFVGQTTAAPEASPAPGPAPGPAPAPAKKGSAKATIIVEPVPATEAGSQAFVAARGVPVRAEQPPAPIEVVLQHSAATVAVPTATSSLPTLPTISADSLIGSAVASLSAGSFPAAAVLAAAAPHTADPAAAQGEIREVVIRVPVATAQRLEEEQRLVPQVQAPVLSLAAHGKKTAAAQASPVQASQSTQAAAHGQEPVSQVHPAPAKSPPATKAPTAKPSVEKVVSSKHTIGQLKVGHTAAHQLASQPEHAAAQQYAKSQGQHGVKSLVTKAAITKTKAISKDATAKKLDGKDNYKGFLSGFVDF